MMKNGHLIMKNNEKMMRKSTSPVCDFVGDVLSRRPASAVRFGDRLAPSAGRYLMGQKGRVNSVNGRNL